MMHRPTKTEMMREARDYIFITLGLISYSFAWAAFLIPYEITTGGTTGMPLFIMLPDSRFNGLISSLMPF